MTDTADIVLTIVHGPTAGGEWNGLYFDGELSIQGSVEAISPSDVAKLMIEHCVTKVERRAVNRHWWYEELREGVWLPEEIADAKLETPTP